MVHPVAIRYFFLGDVERSVVPVLEDIERRLSWRPQTDLTIPDRIVRVGEALLSLKELEYLGHTCSGPVSERLASLCDNVLTRLEQRYVMEPQAAGAPQRIQQPPGRDPVVQQVRERVDDRSPPCREVR